MSNISSMTGYANAKVQTDMGLLSIDMRSVNSRFFRLKFPRFRRNSFPRTEIQRDHLRQNRPRQDGMPLEFSGFRLIGGYGLK